jgi:hypothetical protein
MKTVILRAIIFGSFLILGGYLALKIIDGFKQNARAFDEDLPSAYSLPGDVSSIISKKYIHKIKVNEVLRSKVRNPISLITFDERYSLIIYKINLLENKSVKNLIDVVNNSTDRTTGVTYSVVNNNLFSFQYKAGGVPPAPKIYLTYSGDSLQTTVEGDSIKGYQLLFRNLSIRYSEHGPIDVFIKSVNKANVPVHILFFNRNKSCYFLLMAPNDSGSNVNADILYKLVTDI